jgi:hypothetical protein
VVITETNASIPPSFFDRCKRVFLGRPLTSEQLESERLSNPVALGALSPDAISSTAYGPEQIMIELLPRAGMASFVLLLPIIGVVLFILLLVSASYRGVVTTYTRAGGAYMVARDNFGPRIAQVAAAALLIDYVVTAAVQPAAAAPVPPRTDGGHSHLDMYREPARFAAIRPDFRGRDVLVRRHDSADDRHRPDS